MLQTVFMVFMAFVALVCAFAVLIVVRDILREQREDRRNGRTSYETATQPQPEANPAKEAKECQIVATIAPEASSAIAEEESLAEDDNSIKFQAGNVLTLEEKYHNLAPKFRKFYDEIAHYAGNVPDSKHIKNSRYEEFKLRNTRLVRLLIKRDTVICEFILPNADFKNYISENKVEVKQAATSMKILDVAAVQNAKDSIDIAVRAFEEELAYKKQLAREKQKAAREAKKANK